MLNAVDEIASLLQGLTIPRGRKSVRQLHGDDGMIIRWLQQPEGPDHSQLHIAIEYPEASKLPRIAVAVIDEDGQQVCEIPFKRGSRPSVLNALLMSIPSFTSFTLQPLAA